MAVDFDKIKQDFINADVDGKIKIKINKIIGLG